MASFLQSLPVSSAARKQSTTMPFRLNVSSSASSRTCSSFSTLCSQSRLSQSQNLFHASQYSKPSTKLPIQQTRTFLAQFKRQSQAQVTRTTNLPPSAAANLQLTNLPYFIRRTASNQFPVYLVTKAGGTKRQTKIQKTEGDVDALRDDLALYLGMESGDPRSKNPDVSLNRLNGHITVKGWRKAEILEFLSERNF